MLSVVVVFVFPQSLVIIRAEVSDESRLMFKQLSRIRPFNDSMCPFAIVRLDCFPVVEKVMRGFRCSVHPPKGVR